MKFNIKHMLKIMKKSIKQVDLENGLKMGRWEEWGIPISPFSFH